MLTEKKNISQEKDILNEKSQHLQENPFGVPEGYFSSMRQKASALAEKKVLTPVAKVVRVLAPTVSVAAAVGLFFVGRQLYENHQRAVDQQLYLETFTSSLSSGEIVDYLIYTGASVEEIASSVH